MNGNSQVKKVTFIMVYKHEHYISHAVLELIRQSNKEFIEKKKLYSVEQLVLCFFLQAVNVGIVFGVPQGTTLVPLSLCG